MRGVHACMRACVRVYTQLVLNADRRSTSSRLTCCAVHDVLVSEWDSAAVF